MPGMGRTKKWWERYHEQREEGKSKKSSAKIASHIEKRRKKCPGCHCHH